MHFWQYLVLFVAVLIGGLLAMFFGDKLPKYIKSLTAFSGAFLFGLVISSILPGVYASGEHWVGVLVLLGFFTQFLLEHVLHGHDHSLDHKHEHFHNSSYAISILAGLTVHSFLDGMPLNAMLDGVQQVHQEEGHHHGHNHTHLVGSLIWALFFHKITDAFALVFIMLDSGWKKRGILLTLLLFATITPLGTYAISNMVAHNLISLKTLNYGMAFLMGGFLHIGTTILLETEQGQHRIEPQKLIAIVFGFLVAILLG